MRRILRSLLILSAAVCGAQPVITDPITGNPVTSVTRYGVLKRPPLPRQVVLKVTGPAGCSVAVTDNNVGIMGYISPETSAAQLLPVQIRIRYTNDWGAWNGGAGTFAGAVTFTMSGSGCSTTPATVTLTTVVVNGYPLPEVVYRSPTGASTTPPGVCGTFNSSFFYSPETCTYADLPYNTATPLMPAVGESVIDPVWGATIKRLTDNRKPGIGGTDKPGSQLHGYSALTPFNYDSTTISLEASPGTDVMRISDLSLRRDGIVGPPEDGNTNTVMQATTWDGVLVLDGGVIYKKFFNADGTTNNALTQTLDLKTAPLNLTANANWGGTADMSADGWFGFTDETAHRVCAVDTNGTLTAAKVYCSVDYRAYHPLIDVSQIVVSAGVATVTTSLPTWLDQYQYVAISGVTGAGSALNGNKSIAELGRINSTSFRVSATGVADGTYNNAGIKLDYTLVDSTHVTGIDRISGKRYVVPLFNAPSSRSSLWSVNLASGTLDMEVTPEANAETPVGAHWNNGDGVWQGRVGPNEEHFEVGWAATHSDVQCFDGVCGWVAGMDFNQSNQSWITFVAFHAGAQMFDPVEIGGGLRLIFKLGSTGGINYGRAGQHDSCAPKAAVCEASLANGEFDKWPSSVLSSVTAASPPVLTLASSSSWVTGQAVVFGGIPPNFFSCLGYRATVTRIDATHFSVDGKDCSTAGTYSSVNGVVGEATAPNTPYRYEAPVYDLHHVMRGINMRNNLWPSTAEYRSYAFGALSQDGKWVAFHSGFGLPDTQQYIATTGWDASYAVRPSIVPTATGAIVTVGLPLPQACTFTVLSTTSTAYANTVVEAQTTGISAFHRVVFSGEAASTKYWMRATCGIISHTAPFSTRPAPSGSATLTGSILGVPGAAQIAMYYGPTSALGTVVTATCSEGARCSVSASATRGVVHSMTCAQNGSGVPLACTPISVSQH